MSTPRHRRCELHQRLTVRLPPRGPGTRALAGVANTPPHAAPHWRARAKSDAGELDSPQGGRVPGVGEGPR